MIGPLEHTILADIRVALGRIDRAAFWRNSTGVARHCPNWRECSNGLRCPACGTQVVKRGDLRVVRYGLEVGSADLIGCAAGRLVSLEVKTATGRMTEDQRAWACAVASAGGVAATVRSVDEALAVVGKVRGG